MPTPPQPQNPQPFPGSPFESAPPAGAAPIPTGAIPPALEPQPSMGGAAAVPTQVAVEDAVDLPPGALEDPREFVEMNVAQLLSTVSPQELGLPSLDVSPFASTRIPMAMLKPQLPTGQVFLNLSDVIVGCKPEHRASMVGCNPTVRIKVPIGLIFPTVGEAAGTPPAPGLVPPPEPTPASPSPPAEFGSLPATVEPTPFAEAPPAELAPAPPQSPPDGVPDSPFESPPAADPPASAPAAGATDLNLELPASDLPPTLPGAAEGAAPAGLPPLPGLVGSEPESLPPTALAPTTLPGEETPSAPAAAGSPPSDSPLAALPPLGGNPLSPSEPATASAAEESPPLPPLAPVEEAPAASGNEGASASNPLSNVLPPLGGAPTQAPASQATEAGGWPMEDLNDSGPATAEQEIESLEDLPPVSESGEFTAPQGFESMAAPQSDAQTTLRGLFLTEGKIDAASVAEHVGGLPGIGGCVVLGEDQKIQAASPDGAGFGEQAGTMYRSLCDLAGASGASGSETLTVRVGDDAMVSFFKGEGLALSVKHEPQGFRPGVFERLSVIVRELGKLSSPS